MDSGSTSDLIFYCIFLIFLSFSISLIIIPYVKKIGKKFDFLDNVNSRNLNNQSVVRIGGLGIFLGYAVALIFIFQISFLNNVYLIPLFVGSFMMFLLGITDDLIQLSPYLRLVFQILIATYVISSGIVIENIDLTYFGINNMIINLPWILSYLITIFWLVGITNAVNWIDGLDGLASSITAISTLGIVFLSLMFGNIESTFFACAILGANLGFLKYNLRPASIYMGDGGSYLIGFILASLSITANLNSSQALAPHFPLIILLLPITDMCMVIFKRIFSGKSPFFPDKNHIHHRLLASGLSELKVFNLLSFINFFMIILALFSFKN
tara:strand:- start:403 stop:1380 length:978 start_codon:yes stop_codon:yes gene_type:complete